MSKARQKLRAKRKDPTCVDGKSERRHHAEAMAFVNANQWMIGEIEAALPACLLWAVADSIAKHPGSGESDRAFSRALIADLSEAAVEPFLGMPEATITKGVQTAWRLGVHAYDVPDTGRAYGTLFMGAVYWLQALVDAGFFTIYEGSAFARAAAALFEDIRRRREKPGQEEVFAKMEKAAEKLAGRMQARLEALGLFVEALDGAVEQKAAA